MTRNKVSKICLMMEPCFYCFVHFSSVQIYIFGLHHNRCGSDWKNVTFVKFLSQILSSAGGSLKGEAYLQLFCDGLLVPLYTFLLIHLIYVVKPVYLFMTRSKVSKILLNEWAPLPWFCAFRLFEYLILKLLPQAVD